MQYHGGKAKVGKQIAKVLLEARGDRKLYIEPFVGACGVMEHVAPHFENCYGTDANADMIAFWNAITDGWEPPTVVTEEEYNRLKADTTADPALRGFVSVACSFAGKVWGGYAKSGDRNYAANAKRSINKARDRVENVFFQVRDYRWWQPSNALVYADPPYAKTTGWGAWNHDEFWRWATDLSQNNTVFVSEYEAPEGWECVWERELSSGLNCGLNGSGGKHTERLFRLKA